MKIVTILAFLAATGMTAASADVLFYGGDFDNVNGLKSQHDAKVDARVYEDFSLGEDSLITGIFGTFYTLYTTEPVSAYFEVRSGIKAGNGGTLLASGKFDVHGTQIGGGIGFPVWKLSGKLAAPFELPSGDYFFTMAMVGGPDWPAYFLATTSGDNGVGGPIHNGNTFYDSTTFGYNFIDVQDFFGPGIWDFSVGLEGHAVPEPAATLLILTGVGMLLLRNLRRR